MIFGKKEKLQGETCECSGLIKEDTGNRGVGNRAACAARRRLMVVLASRICFRDRVARRKSSMLKKKKKGIFGKENTPFFRVAGAEK